MDQPDMNQLMQQAKDIQEKIQQAQNELNALEVTGQSGAGLAKVVMNGRHYAKSVKIAPSLLRESKEMIEDMIAAAINDAVQKVEKVNQEKMASMAADMGIDKNMQTPTNRIPQ